MKYLSFYSKYFPNLKENSVRQNVLCPFHDDTTPSCSLDLESGLWYCHSEKEGGDHFKFYMKYHGVSFARAKAEILGNTEYHVLTETEVEEAHNRLLASEHLQKVILIKRGWTLETIKNYELGWSDERVFIPIRDTDGKLLNIRKYDLFHKTQQKVIGVKGYNQITLYPIKALEEKLVVIFAGESDTILARQYGINGITFTSGEGAFRKYLLPNLAEKKVYICYDVDEAGQIAAKNLAIALADEAEEVYIINLPKKLLPEKGDFTDLVFYCVDNGKNLNELWNPCVTLAQRVEANLAEPEIIDSETVDFYEAVREDYFDKNIQFKGIAIGKNLSPFFSPAKLRFTCNFTRGDSCKGCILFATGGEHELVIPPDKALDLIKCSNVEQKTKLKNMVGINKCNQFEMTMETITLEEIFITPTIDREVIDREFSPRKVYTKGHNLRLNKTYSFIGKTINDPKTQEATHLFDRQIPELSDLDTFQLSNTDKEAAKIFQPKDDTFEEIDSKLKDICRDLTYNVPEIIIGREALILACDLVFHSVISFKLENTVVRKGLVELLILGDTRTGKTATATKLCRHYRAGEYLTLETATSRGLIGGIAQIGRDMTFSWGVLPINDGRIVILDEVNGLETKDISELSAIRDIGEASRTVVGSTRKTSARCRIIWISNPRAKNKRIENYTSGVEAIQELIGREEDIARFDFAYIVAKQDVPLERINVKYGYKVQHTYTTDLCNKLLMWAWSRKEKHIKVLRETETAILEYAIEMSRKYSDSIPLVQGTVQRIKIAKLAVALACRLFSTKDGENVIVKPCHVEYVVKFLYSIYDSTYFGYSDYSTFRKDADQLSEIDEVEKLIEQMNNPMQFLQKTLNSNSLVFEDLMDFSGYGREQTKMLRASLMTSNSIKRIKGFYIKTPSFVTFLKNLIEKKKGE